MKHTFDQVYNLAGKVTQITTQQAIHAKKGTVIMVRSQNVKYIGDHFIVITGPPIVKAHGIRPRQLTFPAEQNNKFLNQFPQQMGVTLLKLNDHACQQFLNHHNLLIN